MTTREQKCKDICEANGIHWHEVDQEIFGFRYCECYITSNDGSDDFTNPIYSHPDEILKVAMGRKDFDKFAQSEKFIAYLIVANPANGFTWKWAIPTIDITKPDKLLNAFWEWCKEKKVNDGL